MTLNDHGYCDWSELPPEQCAHCRPVSEPAAPTAPPRRAYVVAHPVAQQTTQKPPTRRLRFTQAIDRDHPADLTDYVTALTEPTRHDEPYTIISRNSDGTRTTYTRRHTTTSPSLLEQLHSAIYSTTAEEGRRAEFASKPSARLDAIDISQRIETEVHAWLRRLDLDMPTKHDQYGPIPDIPAGLRRAAANVPAGKDRKKLTRDVRSWWIAARTITGWDSPTFQPNNTCPLCGARGGLRLRFDAATGICIECGEGWDETTIGLLAEHIRIENGETEESETRDRHA